MDLLAATTTQMPAWWGVIFLVFFALSGRLFRDNWKVKGKGWKTRCWLFGLTSLIFFCLMVFGSFDFT